MRLTARQIVVAAATVAVVPVLILLLHASSARQATRLASNQTSPSPSQSIEPSPTPASGPSPLTPSGSHPSNGALAAFFGPDFSGRTKCKFSHQMVVINGSTLTVSYPQGSSAPSAGAPYGGAQLCVPFTAGASADATLSYDVRFPVGFDFVKGGKLPGLYGGNPPFSGGKHNPDGWSMRLMWRENGTAEVYGYISTTTGYGDDWTGGGLAFQADGLWHHISERVHLNSPGQSDGYVTLSYDGRLYISKTGLPITTTGTPVTGLFFSTFFGGHDSSWAPPSDMHIDFANFHSS